MEKDIAHLRETFTSELRHIRDDNARQWEVIRAEVMRLCRNDDAQWRESERRQRFVMEGVAAIMKHEGVSHRVSDTLSRLLETDEGNENA